MFKYTIGDKTFIQKKLVMGQIDQLMTEVREIKFPARFTANEIKEALGDRLYTGLAIILVEEGKSPRREIEEIQKFANELYWAMDPETIIGVIEDFFDCNPIASISERLSGAMSKVTAKLGHGTRKPASSSPGETSPSETKSSGDIPPQNASPISIIAEGK